MNNFFHARLAPNCGTLHRASGIAWTHLHPNVFMKNLLTFFAPRRGALTVYWSEQRADWVLLHRTHLTVGKRPARCKVALGTLRIRLFALRRKGFFQTMRELSASVLIQ
jgi:hypothetical protein